MASISFPLGHPKTQGLKGKQKASTQNVAKISITIVVKEALSDFVSAKPYFSSDRVFMKPPFDGVYSVLLSNFPELHQDSEVDLALLGHLREFDTWTCIYHQWKDEMRTKPVHPQFLVEAEML
ncbi:hypothetical protein VNO80_01077 [Phaseolus coccineus]|uniref:Uncharacterized protein n=1 Tax=Phaseolus coccineus TaxID=3886 RepID=A0AAN9P3E5_PHACN